MTDFVGTMKLKGQAEEDTWFARHDRELVEALHHGAGAPVEAPTEAMSSVSGGQTGVESAAPDAACADPTMDAPQDHRRNDPVINPPDQTKSPG